MAGVKEHASICIAQGTRELSYASVHARFEVDPLKNLIAKRFEYPCKIRNVI